jgi:uncharacterized cupredoxin-like copper-binding protein
MLDSHLQRVLTVACAASVLCLPDVAATRATGANVVTVVATDFALQLPASLPAGLTTFRLLNHGKQMHHLTVMRLDSGKTVSDAFAAMVKAGHGAHPAWMHPAGGPNATPPGGANTATLVLESGTYLAFCEIPGPTPAPHYMRGMLKGFVVTPPSRPAVLPHADLALKMTDYDFILSQPLTRGRHAIAVTNAASQPHMLVIHRIPSGGAPGAGTKEFLEWAQNPNNRPAPGVAYGGVTEISPGITVVIDEKFEPGKYLLICFVPDAKDGKPHFVHGMQKEIVVR